CSCAGLASAIQTAAVRRPTRRMMGPARMSAYVVGMRTPAVQLVCGATARSAESAAERGAKGVGAAVCDLADVAEKQHVEQPAGRSGVEALLRGHRVTRRVAEGAEGHVPERQIRIVVGMD